MESSEGGMFDGGGIFSASSTLEIRQCRFKENTAAYKGGSIYSENSRMHIMNCTFEMNSAIFGGLSIMAEAYRPLLIPSLPTITLK